MDEPRPAGVNAHPGAAARRGLTRQNLILGAGIRATALLLVVLTPVVAARTLDTSGVAQVMIAVSVATMIGVVGQVGLPFVSLRVAQVRAGLISLALLRGNLRSACLFLLALTVLLLVLAVPPWGVPPDWIVPNATRGMLVAVALAGIGRAGQPASSARRTRDTAASTSPSWDPTCLRPGLGLVVVVVAGVAFGAMTTSEAFAWALAVGWVLAVGIAIWIAPVKPTLARVQHGAKYRLRHGMRRAGRRFRAQRRNPASSHHHLGLRVGSGRRRRLRRGGQARHPHRRAADDHLQHRVA